MRLWHQDLIPIISGSRLVDLHRTCCALRGGGWGQKNSIVDWVFKHNPAQLFHYHMRVMDEMRRRKYFFATTWCSITYRGKNKPEWSWEELLRTPLSLVPFPEFDQEHLHADMQMLAERRDEGVLYLLNKGPQPWYFKIKT